MSMLRAFTVVSIPPLLGAAAAAVALHVTQVHRRIGATTTEMRRPLPGDELLPRADLQNDRACTIQAPPEAVWPWIAQLGQDRAGFYSFQALENVVGCRICNATRIHPEWQRVEAGDAFRLHPDVALRVAAVEPGRWLVVTSVGGDSPGGAGMEMTWAFHLDPAEGQAGRPATRLHLRERYATGGRGMRLMAEAVSVVSALMTWRMLSRLRRLAEDRAHAAAQRPATASPR